MDCITFHPWNPEKLPKDYISGNMPPTVSYRTGELHAGRTPAARNILLVFPPRQCLSDSVGWRSVRDLKCAYMLKWVPDSFTICLKFLRGPHLSQELQNWVLTVHTRNWLYLLYHKTSIIGAEQYWVRVYLAIFTVLAKPLWLLRHVERKATR